jgi:hypothetical protein
MMSCHELFGFMSAPLADEIIHYVHSADKPVYRATLSAVADARKVRPIFLERKGLPERHSLVLNSLTRPRLEAAAAELLRGWLVKAQTQMLTDFLDSLGIVHDHGIAENFPATVDDAKLKAAIELLLSKYPQETVVVYLNALGALHVTRWSNLENLLEQEPRLQLG